MNEQKLTFKQYLESKNQLIEKAKEISIVDEKRRVLKYCKLPTFIIKTNICEHNLNLKPNDTITCQRIIKENQKDFVRCFFMVDDDKTPSDRSFFPRWNQEKIQKWIDKNTSPVK
jgi:hypothetical protein